MPPPPFIPSQGQGQGQGNGHMNEPIQANGSANRKGKGHGNNGYGNGNNGNGNNGANRRNSDMSNNSGQGGSRGRTNSNIQGSINEYDGIQDHEQHDSKPQEKSPCECDDCKRNKNILDYDMIDRSIVRIAGREIDNYDKEIGRRMEGYTLKMRDTLENDMYDRMYNRMYNEMYEHMYEKIYERVYEKVYQNVCDQYKAEMEEKLEGYIDDSYAFRMQQANEIMRDNIMQLMQNDPYRKNVLPPAPPGQQYYYIQTPEQWLQMNDGSFIYMPAQSVPMLASPYITPNGSPVKDGIVQKEKE